jgi:predicted ABC-type ATPase
MKEMDSKSSSTSISEKSKSFQNIMNAKLPGSSGCKFTSTNARNIHEQLFLDRKNTAIVMIGGPGSGKSLIKYKYIDTLNRDDREFVNLDPDFVLENIKAYKQRMTNNKKAASNCKPSADVLRDKLFDFAVNHHFNIILDGTGRNFGYTKSVIEYLNKNNYLVHLVVVCVDPKIGSQRVKDRAKQTKRNIPTNVVDNIYAQLKNNIEKYFDLAKTSLIFKFAVYDNNDSDSDPKMIYKSN